MKNKYKNTIKIGAGQKLWKQASKIIPGGNMFLSKKSETYLPNLWPSYYKSAKGCIVKDLDGNKYFDMTMSVGTNILGYSNKFINNSVIKAIKKSTMTTFNSEEEVKLAKKLIKLHSWSGGVKFARTGGEANALSLRIARAYVKKTKIAFCGYHGWHDWYLSANLNKRGNLDQHLLKNLNTSGVPKELKNTVFPFEYGNYKQFNKILKNQKIGIVKMEVARNLKPDLKFLKFIRKQCNKKRIILIFDECTSGFRQNFGGMHKILKINPDIAVFGKSLGNGFAITAVLGRKKIMEASKRSFISSTFWSEKVGYVAALETLNQMEKSKSWKKVSYLGNYLRKKLSEIIEKHGVNVEIKGLLAIPSFSFKNDKNNILKTFVTQEMLKNGFIINNAIYISTAHNKKILDNFLLTLEKIFKVVKKYPIKKIKKLLISRESISGFGRLN
jgi:glutamate-1-semialdehyde aminotransferase